MKAKQIITIIILLLTTGVLAQEKTDIHQIRKWYNETKKNIENSKKHTGKATLICTIIERNVHKAEGAFHLKQQFWGNFEELNTRKGLQMVIINSNDSHYAEYLYHDGDLVFVFFKDYLNEFRFYFKNDELIKEIKGTKVGEGMYAPTAEDVKRGAAIYMQQYLSDFCTPND